MFDTNLPANPPEESVPPPMFTVAVQLLNVTAEAASAEEPKYDCPIKLPAKVKS